MTPREEFERACNALLLGVPPIIAAAVLKRGQAAIRSAERAARAHERERIATLADAAAVEADSEDGWIAPDGQPHAAPCTLRQFAAAIRALPEAAP